MRTRFCSRIRALFLSHSANLRALPFTHPRTEVRVPVVLEKRSRRGSRHTGWSQTQRNIEEAEVALWLGRLEKVAAKNHSKHLPLRILLLLLLSLLLPPLSIGQLLLLLLLQCLRCQSHL